ncbi:unnamed protein product, partial [Musa hybrid cultivar]
CSPLRQLPARTLPSICSLINLPPFSLFLSSSSSYSPAPAPMAPLPAPSPSLSSETGYRSATTSTTGTSWAWRRSRVTCSCCGSGRTTTMSSPASFLTTATFLDPSSSRLEFLFRKGKIVGSAGGLVFVLHRKDGALCV